MSLAQPPQLAKLIISVFLNDKELLPTVAHNLETAYGPLDMVSNWFDFNFTDYYKLEMGAPLYRRMLVFKKLIQQQELAAIKQHTNGVENVFAVNAQRQVNIDPGYLLYERFVLATGKNYSHRIYIGLGIYADLTLIYQDGNFQPLPWTYPDYAQVDMRAFLLQVRQKFSADLRRRQKTDTDDGATNTLHINETIKE